MRESSGRPTAKNPKSTAFGLWQGLDAIRHKYCTPIGVDPNSTDAGDQVACMRRYIDKRYGSAEKALAFWYQKGYY